MRVKICGITQAQQGKEIAALGATALGFICVERSPRYVNPQQISVIVQQLPSTVDRIGVFADEIPENIADIVTQANLTGVQLHGTETPDFCCRLRRLIDSEIEIIKAFRIKTPESLTAIQAYFNCVDTLLLDAYDPQALGGTGKTINWQDLQQFKPDLPWFLAGGLNPDNVVAAITNLHPNGIDLSSGVEKSPGDKDLNKVARLFNQIQPKNLPIID
ncbi:MAG: phosphoribosylanthranilate isomerase [Pleurocapsa sp.]